MIRMLCLAGGLLSAACARPHAGTGDALGDERAVHRALLEYWAEKARPRETLYVAPTDQPPFSSEAAADAWADRGGRAMMGGVPPHMLRAWARANVLASHVSVPRSIKGRPVTAAAPREGRGAVRYVLRMSRPGFNGGGDSAVVSASWTCGTLCGTSAVLLAVRDMRGWTIARELSSVLH